MAEFITKCPHCRTELQVKDEWNGMEIECPQCRQKFCLQPLSEEQTIIPPPIKLAPLFLNKSTSNLPNHNKSDEALFDPKEDKKEEEYEIDSTLANVSTMIPLPQETCKQCIQLLCQATGTIAFEDVNGKIWIKKNNSSLDDYMLSLKTNLTFPKYSEEPSELRNLVITKYIPQVETERSKLIETTFTLNGTSDVELYYDLSTDHTYEIQGATVNSGTFYGECCKLNLTVTGNGDISFIAYGKKIDLNENRKLYGVSTKGSDCELDFAMLSDDNLSDYLAEIYKKYLSESKRYEIDYRGNPELRPNDIIQLQTKFIDEVNAMILSTNYSYSNGSSGNIVLKSYNLNS